MLCRALTDTGRAGRPEEYFLCGPPDAFPPGWRFWEHGIFAAGHDGLTRAQYLDLVYELGTTPNGVFGAKLMWNNVSCLLEHLAELPQFRGLDRASAFRTLLPDLRVIRLLRRDRRRQAVSWARAAQDGVWVVSETEPRRPSGAPVYDADLIGGLEGLLLEGERGWPELCDELEVVPLTVHYEDLVDPAGYEATVRAVLAHLGLDDPDLAVPPPRTRRQADPLNEQWARRYEAERGGHPQPSPPRSVGATGAGPSPPGPPAT